MKPSYKSRDKGTGSAIHAAQYCTEGVKGRLIALGSAQLGVEILAPRNGDTGPELFRSADTPDSDPYTPTSTSRYAWQRLHPKSTAFPA
eukprot:2438393-Rhodomonas_salina.2